MTDQPALPPLSREEILALPGKERLPYVEQIRVIYPRWNAILDDIAACHRRQPYAAEPPCLLLIGPTGAGKSTLLASYARQYPRITTLYGTQVPVLCATIPAKATIKNLLTELLDGLGDPRAASGTIGGMTLRLKGFIRDCGVQVFILDELQHFVDQESQKILLNVSNWLKTLVKETRVACVLVGLGGQAEQVVNANPQLARLFGDPRVLRPFRWDEADPATHTEFRSFLMQLEAMLPLREPTRLAGRERAWRCFVACAGVTAYLMALIRQATEDALLAGRECLDDALLAGAFRKRLAGERRGIGNPFEGDPPLCAQPETAPLATASAQPAISRRGRPKGARKQTLSDIVRS
ncbi:MAG: TniB family NTP-binding protein [Roseiflexaceae bacterium]